MRESNTQPRRSRRRHNTTYCCSPTSARSRRRSGGVPTAIGGTRRVAIVPEAQSAARAAVGPGRDPRRRRAGRVQGLLARRDRRQPRRARACGTARTGRRASSAWRWSSPACGAATTSTRSTRPPLRRPGAPGRRPRPDRARRSAPRPGRPGRVALPAVIGLDGHAEAWADARSALPARPVRDPARAAQRPGHPAVRRAAGADPRVGGRIQVGEQVHRIEVERRRVVAVELEAATRDPPDQHRTRSSSRRAGSPAAGWSPRGEDGWWSRCSGLPVEAPTFDAWLRREALDPAGHPIEAAGIRTDRAAPARRGRPQAGHRQRAGRGRAARRASERCASVRRRDRDRAAAGAPPGELTDGSPTATPSGRAPAASRSAA